MNFARLERAGILVQQAVSDRVCTAAVLLVGRHHEVIYEQAFGKTEENGTAATVETLFDLASLTKPVTAALLMMLVEHGIVSLSRPFSDYWPEMDKTEVGRITIRQLATHTSGLPSWLPLYQKANCLTGAIDIIANEPLEREPGSGYNYSDLGYILLGALIQQLTGESLDRLVKQKMGEPLDWKYTGYHPAIVNLIAATGNCNARPDEKLRGIVHDANCWALGGVTGHAGLFGTAREMAALAFSLLPSSEQPTPFGQRLNLLSPAAAKICRESQIPASIGGHSIGWFTADNDMLPAGDLMSRSAFGHTGFTGTMIVADPGRELVLVLLTNRVYYPGDNHAVSLLRRHVANVVSSACR